MMFGRRVIQVARGGGSIVAANAGMHATISRRTVAAAASQQHQHQHHQQQSCWANVFSIVAGGAGFVAAAGNVFIDDAAAADAEEKPAKMTCTSEVCTTDDFATMAEEHGVQIGNGVVLQEGANGRGLFTTTGCEDGALLIRVPTERCLFIAADDPEMQEDSGGLGWSFWMMLKLLRTSDKTSVYGDSFWQKYREKFMPSLEEVAKTIPAGMSREWLDAYSKEVPVVQEVGRLRDRLDATCKRLADREPSVSMVWGLASVLSRCFALDALATTVALVPFIDMLNHGNYNAKLRVDITKTSVFVYATRDLEPGEEILISYADDAPNKALFMKYGFVLSGGSADDIISFPSTADDTLSADRLQEFLKAEHGGDAWEATLDNRIHIVLNSLPIVPQSVTIAEEIKFIAELQVWLAQAVSDNKALQERKDTGPLSYYLSDELATLEAAAVFLSNYAAYLQKAASLARTLLSLEATGTPPLEALRPRGTDSGQTPGHTAGSRLRGYF